MPQVLTTGALIQCPHGGVGTSTPSSVHWMAEGALVLVEGDTGVIVGCTLPLSGLAPCATYVLRSMGLNATTLDARRVILATDVQQSNTGLPLTIADFHHVLDDTTTAPLPPRGAPSPAPAPELMDFLPPVVTVSPPALAFNTATMQGTTLGAVFSLTTEHPMQWTLTQISSTGSTDLTNGAPLVTLAPVGGAWDQPHLDVALALDSAYMTALGPGPHRFYLSGVSKRGLTGLAELALMVT